MTDTTPSTLYEALAEPVSPDPTGRARTRETKMIETTDESGSVVEPLIGT